jgi:hypothetical protein
MATFSSGVADGTPASTTAEGAGRAACCACVVVGMAGSGKTTLMQRLNLHCVDSRKSAYFVNMVQPRGGYFQLMVW